MEPYNDFNGMSISECDKKIISSTEYQRQYFIEIIKNLSEYGNTIFNDTLDLIYTFDQMKEFLNSVILSLNGDKL